MSCGETAETAKMLHFNVKIVHFDEQMVQIMWRIIIPWRKMKNSRYGIHHYGLRVADCPAMSFVLVC